MNERTTKTKRTQFDIDRERDQIASAKRRDHKRALADKLKTEHGADDVYVTDLNASLWFTGQKPGAKFFPARNESLLVIKF